MKYMGSKNRISKYIVPIIESNINEDQLFVDLFVGGFNLVDKITKTKNIICNDNNPYLIALFQEIYKTNGRCLYIYDTISEEFYKSVKDNKDLYPEWLVGLIGFCATFGARFYEGYARGKKANGQPRDIPNESIRNIRQQWDQYLSKMQPTIMCADYKTLTFSNAVIYADKPYSTGKKYYQQNFSEEEFWEKMSELSENNIVFISEYEAPEDFVSIYSIDITSGLNKDTHVQKTEKLFVHKKILDKIKF